MPDRGGEFRFFQGIHVRIDIRIDISISLRPMITRFGKQVHLQDLKVTNADLKICQCFRLHVKKYVEGFTLKRLLLFEICRRKICEKFVYKHSKTIECVKN